MSPALPVSLLASSAKTGVIALLAPSGLLLLGLLVPLVVLYILKIQRRRRVVASTWLWAEAQRDLMARSPWRRLRARIPLVLQALALLALGLAFARPATRGRALTGDHVAIILDVSASMSARADGAAAGVDPRTRLDLAKAAARDILASLAPGGDALVLEAGRDARLLAPLDRDKVRLAAVVDRATPREVEGDLGAAVALAVDRLQRLGGSRRVVVITDGNLARPASLSGAALPLEIITVGAPVDNAAIVRVDVRAGTDPVLGTPEVQGFLVVENFGRAPRPLYVTMREQNVEGVLASRREVIAPGERRAVQLDFHPAPGDRNKGLVFEISPHDAMPADDVAYARVPAGDQLPVFLAGASPWMERALAADSMVELRAGTMADLGAAGFDRDTFVVIDGACPPSPPGGDLLIVHPPPGACFGTTVGAVVEHPELTSWETADPRLRFLTLEGVHVARANLLEPGGPLARLVSVRAGALVTDISTSARSGTLVGFDVGDSDWPLQASFVLFVRNLLEQARAHRAHGVTGAARAGEPLRVGLPATATEVEATGPGGERLEVARRGDLAVISDPARVGFYRVSWRGPQAGSTLVPVNLTSAAESDLTPRPLAVDAARVTVSAAAPPDAHDEWAWALALLALALVVLDVWYLTRGPRDAAITRAALARRPALLAGMIAGALPALHVGLSWAGVVPDAYLRLARPWVTLLALGATTFIALRLALSSRRGHADPRRLLLGDLLTMTAALAAAMAAAGPEMGRPLDRLAILVAVDRSRSIDLVPGAEERVRRELAVAELSMRDDDRLGVVAFAAEAATEDPPRPRSELAAPQRVVVGRDGTDLAAAIRRSLAEVPSDAAARVVLITDGLATRGDTLAAAAAALAAGIPVDVVPLEQRAAPDVRVVALRAPARADEGEAMDLRVVTSSPAAADLEVRVRRDGEVIARARARIQAGEDVLRLREKAPGPGLHRYDVEITALDPRLDEAPEDNTGSAFVRVRGQAAALVLEGEAGKGAFLARALAEGAFRVEQGTATSVPADLGGLAGYDVVVLSDIRAGDLSPGQLAALAGYVRDLGGGLVLMGGDRSMGPGGYARTPVEEVSPVSFDLRQERRRASLAEVIGIDISGSMGAKEGGFTKLALANEAAARSAALLGPGDLLGVAHVDTEVKWSVPLGPVVDKLAIDRAIRGVGVGGGGIYVDVTLDAGYAALDREKVNLKHLLLFADGSDAERMDGCRARVEGALRRGITTSVVALGSGSDVPELETLSRLGGGRFYLVEDATRLPAVFAQETILAARSAIVEKDFRVDRGAPSAITEGVDLAEAPSLKGYVVTIAKGRASVLLRGPEGDPILAVWSAGVGRTAAFTSDLKDRWGAAWTAWPGAARMIAQAARDVARKGEDPRVRLDADAGGGELHLRAIVVGDDGRARSFRRFVAHVAGPDGFARETALEATGAGAYAASVPLSRPGVYLAVARDELTGAVVGTTGAVLTAGEELRPTGSDGALLARIAALTGGKRRDTLAGIFGDRASRSFSYEDATRPLVALAAFGLLLAVAARRLSLPEGVTAWPRRLLASLGQRRPVEASAERAPAEATLGALLDARERRAREREVRAPPRVASPSVARPPSPAMPAQAGPGIAARPAAPAPLGEEGHHGAPPGRGLTTAEILLARRKGKRP